MSDIWPSVILSPLGTPLTYWSILSSSERSPSSAAWRSRLAVKVLVTLPIRWCTSGVIGSLEARSATPRAPIQVYWGVCTAATTPGASLSLNDFSNAASRSASDACSMPPVVRVPAPESPWPPPPPPHPLPSRITNTVTKRPLIHNRWCIPWANNLNPFPTQPSACHPSPDPIRKPRTTQGLLRSSGHPTRTQGAPYSSTPKGGFPRILFLDRLRMRIPVRRRKRVCRLQPLALT